MEGTFSCIKSFAQLLSNITLNIPKGHISLGICGEDGKTKIISLSVTELKDWHAKGKGLLGCELAEGWIHKWKPNSNPHASLQSKPVKTE